MKVTGIRSSASEPRALIPAAYAKILEQALVAVGEKGSGICLTGEAGTSRTALLEQLIAALPADVAVTRLTPASAPVDITTLITGALEESRAALFTHPRVLVVVDDADKLRRDTLDLLDELATLILDGKTAPQLLLVGDTALISRLTAIQHHSMLAYLGTRLVLPRLTPAEKAEYLASQGVDDSQLLLASPPPVPGPGAALPDSEDRRATPAWLVPGLTGLGLFAAGGLCAWLLLPYLAPQVTSPPLPQATELTRPAFPVEPPANTNLPPLGTEPPAEPLATPVPSTPPDTAQAVPDPEDRPGSANPAEAPALAAGPDTPFPPPATPPEPTPTAPPEQAGTPPEPSPSPQPLPEPAVVATPELPPRSPIVPEQAPPRQTEALSTPPAPPGPRVPDQAGGPGLLLVARPGDTLPSLYRQVYAGVRAPSYAEVVAANPGVVRPGTRLIFPTPPGGWRPQ